MPFDINDPLKGLKFPSILPPPGTLKLPGQRYLEDQIDQAGQAIKAGKTAKGMGIGLRGVLTAPLAGAADIVMGAKENVLPPVVNFFKGFAGVDDSSTQNAVNAAVGSGRASEDRSAGAGSAGAGSAGKPLRSVTFDPATMGTNNSATAAQAASTAQPGWDLAGQNARAAATLAAAANIGTQPGGYFEAGYRGSLPMGSPYGTPGPGGGPTTADIIGESGGARGMGANWRARVASRAAERRAMTGIAQQNAEANLMSAGAHQMTAANQFPIAQMNNIPAMIQANAHVLTAQNQWPIAQMGDVTARRGQDAAYAPHGPDVALKTEAMRLMGLNKFDEATKVLTAGSPRQVHPPLPLSMHFDTLGNRHILNSDTREAQFTSMQTLIDEEKARKEKALKEAASK